MSPSAAADGGLDDLTQAVRLEVYRGFIENGRPGSVAEMAATLGLPASEIAGALRRLHDLHALVLEPGTGEVRMAAPFSALPSSLRVSSGRRAWWANCAWDGLAIPGLLKIDARFEARCPDCQEEVAFGVAGGVLEEGAPGPVFHLLVPAARFWADIAYT